MRDMNRRLALTVAGSSALVAITAGAAIAANLGILAASPKAGVGQLDATRVAELAVSTPASIAATQPIVVAPVEAPGPVEAPSIPTVSVDVPRSTWVATVASQAPEAPAVVETPAPTPTPTSNTHDDEYDDEYDDEHEVDYEVEGSLDDHVQDDAFLIESPHQLEEVHISERIR
jgi:hypothetical protein